MTLVLHWKAEIAQNEAWQLIKETHIAKTEGIKGRDKYRKEMMAEQREALTMTEEEKEERFQKKATSDEAANCLLKKQENWLKRWDSTLDD